MNSAPLVSVGLFVYNGERFIEEALNSILNQTFTDFELIISDNASTDRTGEIARAYAKRDERIRYYRSEKNMGAGWNVRRVYELATGKYFKQAAVDDLSNQTSFVGASTSSRATRLCGGLPKNKRGR